MSRRCAVAIAMLVACRAPQLDTPAEGHAATDRAAAVALVDQLATLPGVTRASAIVHTPWTDPLSAAVTRGAASIVIALAPGADQAALVADARRIAATGLALEPAAIDVIGLPTLPPPTTLARLGPFTVGAGSRPALLATLVLGLIAIAGLAAWVAVLELRRRRR